MADLAISMSICHRADPSKAITAKVSDTQEGSLARARGVTWFACLYDAKGDCLAFVDTRHRTPRVLVRGLKRLGLSVSPMLGVDLGRAA